LSANIESHNATFIYITTDDLE